MNGKKMGNEGLRCEEVKVQRYRFFPFSHFSLSFSIFLFSLLFVLPLRASDTLKVTFTGDILLDRGVRRAIDMRGIDQLFSSSVDSVFRHSDFVVANLECPATNLRQPVFKRFIFRADPEWLNALAAHGITHLNLANNHSIDQGRNGLRDTWENIRRAGMVPFGAGETMQAAATPLLIAEQPRRIYLVASLQMALENYAFLPQQPSVSMLTTDEIVETVSRLRRSDPDCCIVVSLHWGAEHTLKPTFGQRMEGHRIVRAGADCLICHHTHTLQSTEQFHGRSIYYSIGNFIFDQMRPLNSVACMVQLYITKDRIWTETIPVTIRQCVPYVTNP